MESVTCDGQQGVQQVDVLDGLAPPPTDIKAQMPILAEMLQSLAANVGRERVQAQVKASVDLRRAFDADDYAEVRRIYRRGHGWISAREGGYCLGVPAQEMAAFARRHRGHA